MEKTSRTRLIYSEQINLVTSTLLFFGSLSILKFVLTFLDGGKPTSNLALYVNSGMKGSARPILLYSTNLLPKM